jgi:flavin-dependent dehydrogenase
MPQQRIPQESPSVDIAIAGAGIGGLVLALRLHAVGVPCRVYEAVPEIKPLGVGIIREVRDRTGDRPFDRIEDVISQEELAEISRNYKNIAGMTARSLLTTEP